MLYLVIFIFLMPPLLLLAGALAKTIKSNARIRRLQLEGAGMMTAGHVATWIIYDMNFGIDPYGEQRWTYWFDQAEPGLFWIGLLFFGLGYFIERRPRPGLAPWPMAGKIFCVVFILFGCALNVFARSNLGLAFVDIPWSIDRVLFLLGLYPFCVGYAYGALRFTEEPPPNIDIEDDIA